MLFWDCFYILGLSGYEMDVVESIVWGFGIFWGGQSPLVVGLGVFVRIRVFFHVSYLSVPLGISPGLMVCVHCSVMAGKSTVGAFLANMTRYLA